MRRKQTLQPHCYMIERPFRQAVARRCASTSAFETMPSPDLAAGPGGHHPRHFRKINLQFDGTWCLEDAAFPEGDDGL